VQEPDLEAIKTSAIAAYANEEVPLLSASVLLTPNDPDHPGFIRCSVLDLTWRPHVTMRNSLCRVHIVIESTKPRDPHDTLPPRYQLRFAIEQGPMRFWVADAVRSLQGRHSLGGREFFTWTVGSVVFAGEPPLGEGDYMRPVDIDADKPDPWAPRSA